MISWKNIRLSLLSIQLFVILTVLTKSIIYPTVKDTPKTNLALPTTVILPEWQLVKTGSVNSQLVQPPAYISGKYITGKSYQYIKNDILLDIEMRYLIHTKGDLKSFIKSYTGQILPFLYEQQGIGFYSMFTYQQRAYLSACINPYGYSTVTGDQFRRNGLRYALSLERIASWLTSQTEIVDKRCLWAHLSIPLNNSSQEEAYRTLENVWFDWYQWWNQNFPET